MLRRKAEKGENSVCVCRCGTLDWFAREGFMEMVLSKDLNDVRDPVI